MEIVDQEVFSQTGKSLNDLELLVVQGTLANQTYEQIATTATAYSVHNLKNVGTKLWRTLSEVLDEKVTKRNLKKVLEQWAIRRKITIHREQKQSQYFIEDLGNEIQLEMVSIPEGSFLMGSPEDELDSYDMERPQHEVIVSAFFIGRYPITQAQWREVANWEQVERELDHDPSRFKEDYEGRDRWTRPVEQVSWEEAKEFCARLSKRLTKISLAYRSGMGICV